MKLRQEFVFRALAPDANVAALCREYGISRQKGYKWINRFREQGEVGLEDRSRRPRSRPLEVSGEVVLEIIELRRQHPHWGGVKLRQMLYTRHGEEAPSVRSVDRVIKRAGLVNLRKRRQITSAPSSPPVVRAEKPNDLWTVDFKGWWRTGDGARCEPLTIRDAASRFVFDIRVLSSTRGELVREVFESLFDTYGLPDMIQSDNGSPFASSQSLAGLTKLSAWWAAQGIVPIRGRPGCPQDNGAHERLHTDIRIELQGAAAATLAGQQDACDVWRHEFNHVRPHQALDLKTPAEVYVPSRRRYADAVIGGYPDNCELRVVGRNGTFSYRNQMVFASKALDGHHIGIEQTNVSAARVWLGALLIGMFTPGEDGIVRAVEEVDDQNAREQGREKIHEP